MRNIPKHSKISEAANHGIKLAEIFRAHNQQGHKTKDCRLEHQTIKQFQNVNLQKRKRRKEEIADIG